MLFRPFCNNDSMMLAIFFNYQSSAAPAILKPCIDFHFSTCDTLGLTCLLNTGPTSQSSCAESMSWWRKNKLLHFIENLTGLKYVTMLCLYIRFVLFLIEHQWNWIPRRWPLWIFSAELDIGFNGPHMRLFVLYRCLHISYDIEFHNITYYWLCSSVHLPTQFHHASFQTAWVIHSKTYTAY